MDRDGTFRFLSTTARRASCYVASRESVPVLHCLPMAALSPIATGDEGKAEFQSCGRRAAHRGLFLIMEVFWTGRAMDAIYCLSAADPAPRAFIWSRSGMVSLPAILYWCG